MTGRDEREELSDRAFESEEEFSENHDEGFTMYIVWKDRSFTRTVSSDESNAALDLSWRDR